MAESVKLIRAGQTISAISRTSNVVTVTLSSTYPNSNLVAGQQIVIDGVTDSSFDGTFTIASVASQTSFTYAQTDSNGSSSGGTAGGDYSTFSAWESGEQADITATGSNVTAVAECYNDWASGLTTSNVEIRGDAWTVDATHWVEWRVASGEDHGGDPDAGFWVLNTEATHGLGFVRPVYMYFWLKDFRVKASAAGKCAVAPINNSEDQFTNIDRCIFRDHTSTTYGDLRAAALQSRCCLFMDGYRTCVKGSPSTTGIVFENCGAANYSSYAYIRVLCKNCWEYSSSGFYSEMGTGTDYNASEDTSAQNTNVIENYTAADEFNDPTNDDFTLKASTTSLDDFGTNLYDATDFATDITGAALPSSGGWPVGPYLAAAGGGAVTGTGALDLQTSQVDGSGVIGRIGSGALSAQTSEVAGTGTVGGVVTGTGTLAYQDSAISGSGVVGRVGTGALSSQASFVDGVGSVVTAGYCDRYRHDRFSRLFCCWNWHYRQGRNWRPCITNF